MGSSIQSLKKEAMLSHSASTSINAFVGGLGCLVKGVPGVPLGMRSLLSMCHSLLVLRFEDFPLEALVRRFLLTGACACIFSFSMMEGNMHTVTGTEHTSSFLHLSLLLFMRKEEEWWTMTCFLLYSFTSLFFSILLFLALCISPSLLDSVISRCRILCGECFRTMGHRIPYRLIIRRFCSELGHSQKMRAHHVVAKAQLKRLLLQAWFMRTACQAAVVLGEYC